MANTKISALTAATTPVAGTEVLPIVQSSTTKQVSIANLTAGRSVSAADYVMSTGNLVPSTAAKGINFTANTPASGMTSQLLNWYEEGNYTPTVTAAAGAITSYTLQSAKYTRIGRSVFATVQLTITNAGTGLGSLLITVPYSASGAAAGSATETAVVGFGGRTRIANGDNTMYCVFYNNTSMIVNNYVITASITYST